MAGEHLHGHLAVFRHVHIDLPHAQDHDHNLRVEGHVFRQQDAAAFQVRLDKAPTFLLLLKRVAELVHHRSGEQGLGHKAVHPGLLCLFRHVVPVVGSQDDDGRVVAHDGTDPAASLHPVHLRHLPVYQDQVVGFTAGMAHPHHFNRFRAGQGRFAADAHLPHHQLGVFAGHRVVVDDQHAHILRLQVVRVRMETLPFRALQGQRHGKGGSFPLFAFHFNRSLHHFHQVLGDGHAQPRTAVLAGSRRILLAEGIKNLRQIFLAHADARVADGKTQSGIALALLHVFHDKTDRTSSGRKLHRVAQDVDQHLPQLHVIADVIVVEFSYDAAFVIQPLVPALAADDGVDLLHGRGEGKLLVPYDHAPRLDAGHIQNIVDDVQQVMGRSVDLFQRFPGLFGNIRIAQGDIVQADDGVHGRADLVAHIGKESGLGPVGLFRGIQRAVQCLDFRHAFPLFRDVGNEHIVNAAVGFRLRKMAVVVHPAYRAVLADDAVFHIVKILVAPGDLVHDGVRDGLVIVRMQHAFEGVTGELLELFQIFTAENLKDGPVDIEQFFRLLRLIYEEAAGHVAP